MTVFTRHLLEKGHRVRVYDIDCSRSRALAEKYGCQTYGSLREAASGAEMALLCTPIRETPGVIRAIAKEMRPGSILCEVSSFKMGTAAALRERSLGHVRPLAIHPMFGPDVGTLRSQTVVVVPVSDRDGEVALVESLFGDVNIVVADAETHDRVMASVLSLPYFMNLAFASTLSGEDRTLMREMAGTTFTAQQAVTHSVVGESPELIESLISDDTFAMEAVNRFIDECKRLRGALGEGPGALEHICDGLRERVLKEREYADARRARDAFINYLREQESARTGHE